MKPLRKLIPVILLGLLLVAFAVVTAQTPSQGEQNKKTETCCAMETCCCNNGSCPMKKEGAANAEGKHECCCSGDSCDLNMKNQHAVKAESAGGHQCCACCGDSCDMNMKHDATMKHDANMKHDKDAKADCCNAKHKNKTKAKKAA